MQKIIIIVLLLAAWTLPSLACDGTPPELVNKDDQNHDYELVCGKTTEKKTIAAKSSQSLENKSGCKLKLGDNKAARLYTEMVCTIKDAKLSCELL
ncbi:MAG: hypothetical protein ABIJ56_06225 [Pseudomonadota bacterium]